MKWLHSSNDCSQAIKSAWSFLHLLITSLPRLLLCHLLLSMHSIWGRNPHGLFCLIHQNPFFPCPMVFGSSIVFRSQFYRFSCTSYSQVAQQQKLAIAACFHTGKDKREFRKFFSFKEIFTFQVTVTLFIFSVYTVHICFKGYFGRGKVFTFNFQCCI